MLNRRALAAPKTIAKSAWKLSSWAADDRPIVMGAIARASGG
jgi:hypothetical protein